MKSSLAKSNPGTTVYDSGTVTLTIGGFQRLLRKTGDRRDVS